MPSLLPHFTPITNVVQSLGFTRDSVGWFWGRLVSGATIVMGVVALGGPLFNDYLTPQHQKWLIVAAVVVLWLAGRYDSSPLPGGKRP